MDMKITSAIGNRLKFGIMYFLRQSIVTRQRETKKKTKIGKTKRGDMKKNKYQCLKLWCMASRTYKNKELISSISSKSQKHFKFYFFIIVINKRRVELFFDDNV